MNLLFAAALCSLLLMLLPFARFNTMGPPRFASGGDTADMALNFSGATTGASLTAPILGAARRGGTGWTFGLNFGPSHTGGGAVTHTTVESGAGTPSYPTPFVIAGGSYDASTDKILQIDMSSRTGNDGKYEGFTATCPGGFTEPEFVISGFINFGLIGGATDAAVDQVSLYSGSYAIMQQRVATFQSGTAGVTSLHSSVGDSDEYAITSGAWYRFDLHHSGTGGFGRMLLRDPSTGAAMVFSKGTGTLTELGSWIVWDYLVSYGGTTKFKGLVQAWGAKAVFPLGAYTQAAPTSAGVTQSGPTELTLTWTSVAETWTIRKRVNSGSWSTVSSAQTTKSYIDSSVSVADVVEYGITANLGAHTSTETVSSPFTVTGGGSGFVIKAHVSLGSTANGATSSAVNTIGANLLVAAVSDYTGASSTFSDSEGNTWTPLTAQVNFTPANRVNLFWCVPGAKVAAAHTFVIAGTGSFPAVEVVAFSGANASPFDQEGGASFNGVTSAQPGSLTPSVSGALVILAAGFSNGSGVPTATGYVVSDYDAVASGFGGVLLYKIQTTAVAENPTVNFAVTDSGAMKIAVFKPV